LKLILDVVKITINVGDDYMGHVYSFEDYEGADPSHAERLDRVGFALNQLFDAIAQDAQKILARRGYEDREYEIGLQTELILFCGVILQERRRLLLEEVGLEEIEEMDSDIDVEDGFSANNEEKFPPISKEDVEKFRRMLGDTEGD
jgi:hypothetical protein